MVHEEDLSVTAAAGDDADLARRLREGNRFAAAAVFDRYAALVRRVLMRTLGPGIDLEDHLQETFLRFFREVRTLRDEGALRAFLVSIAIRTARGELRKRRVRRILHLSPPHELPETASDGEDVEAREAVRRLFTILDDLDTSSRLAFTLRHLEEMELGDVASAMGESLSTVKRRLARVEPMVRARMASDAALSAYAEVTP